MAEWDGKSRGNLLGYKIFVFTLKKLGLGFAYFLLIFVATYYFLFSWKSSSAIYYYLHKRMGFSILKSVVGLYRNYYSFGQTLIDRILIGTGGRNKFKYNFDGIENLINTFNEGEGAILISGHIGNFEVSEYFFDDLDQKLISNILTTDQEKANIKNYLQQFSLQSRNKYLTLKDDMSHLFEINAILQKNEFLCLTGDRYQVGHKVLEAEFLGEKATFPAGPFVLGTRLRRPVIFVYVMKDSSRFYHLYARVAKVKARDEQSLLEEYVKNLTGMVEKYPYQWYNYYDFWK